MFVAHYDLFKTSRNIRELIFHKIIKLIVKDSFKYLGHMGQKTNWSVILLVHTIHFLKKLQSLQQVLITRNICSSICVKIKL